MSTFSIKDIEALSGIKCHTIRIWEQRYGVITPKRTDTNIRYYDDDDLKYILNVSILNRYGFKISDISKMSGAEIKEAILKISCNKNEYDCRIKNLVQSMMVFDEFGFHKILTENIKEKGMEETMMKIVFPFLIEVGLLWQVGSIHPSHEHFASNIVKQKLHVAIDENVGKYNENRKRFLLFLPEREQHSLGLLFANYLIRARGHEVLYLGQEVPLNNLKHTFGDHTPEFIFTILTSAHLEIEKQEFVNELSEYWKGSKILLSGSQFLNADLEYPENVRLIKRLDEFLYFINELDNKTNQN